MTDDSIITEIRQTRERFAEQFQGDVEAMLRDLRQRQKKSGRTVVSFPPKLVETVAGAVSRRREAS